MLSFCYALQNPLSLIFWCPNFCRGYLLITWLWSKKLMFLGQELGADYNHLQRPHRIGSVFTFTLPCYRALTSPGGEHYIYLVPWVLSSVLVFVVAALGTPLDNLVLVTGVWLTFLGRTRLWQLKKELIPCHEPPSLQAIVYWDTPLSFCEGGLFARLRVLAWGAGFRFGTHLVVYGIAL